VLVVVHGVHEVLCWGRHADDFFGERVNADVTVFRIH
jgi:hypothetical protein